MNGVWEMEVEEIDLSCLDIKDTKDKKRPHGDSVTFDIAYDDTEGSKQVRRSSRKRIRPTEVSEKRRIVMRPRKLNATSTDKEIENYYLDKKIQLSSPALETIFEEPKKNDMFMSNRKLKRCIAFGEVPSDKPDKTKLRKRTMKAKKIMKGGFKKLGKKLGLDILINKLKDLDNIEEIPV